MSARKVCEYYSYFWLHSKLKFSKSQIPVPFTVYIILKDGNPWICCILYVILGSLCGEWINKEHQCVIMNISKMQGKQNAVYLQLN